MSSSKRQLQLLSSRRVKRESPGSPCSQCWQQHSMVPALNGPSSFPGLAGHRAPVRGHSRALQTGTHSDGTASPALLFHMSKGNSTEEGKRAEHDPAATWGGVSGCHHLADVTPAAPVPSLPRLQM